MLTKLLTNIKNKQFISLEKISTLLEIFLFASVIYCIWQFPYCYKIFGTILTLLLCNLFFYLLKEVNKKNK